MEFQTKFNVRMQTAKCDNQKCSAIDWIDERTKKRRIKKFRFVRIRMIDKKINKSTIHYYV